MKKHFSLCVIMALFLMVGCATLQSWIGQPQLQTYTFNYDGHDYSALLPKDVPMPPKFAENVFDWNPFYGPVYVLHVRYVKGQYYPTTSFWFTQDLGVVALVYHVKLDGTETHIPYIYLKGLPVKVSGDEIEQLFKGWMNPPK